MEVGRKSYKKAYTLQTAVRNITGKNSQFADLSDWSLIDKKVDNTVSKMIRALFVLLSAPLAGEVRHSRAGGI